jgi:dipeptidyl aminopeptidase/acylaminoacyl peptidase
MTSPTRIIKRLAGVLLIAAALVLAAPAAQDKPAPAAPAAGPQTLDLTIPNIMKGEELTGTAPSSVEWSYDGKLLYFRWKKPGEKSPELYALDPASPEPKKTTAEEMAKRPPLSSPLGGRYGFMGMRSGRGDMLDKRHTRALIMQGGKVDLLDLRTGKRRNLIQTDEPPSSVDFTFDEKAVSFIWRENLYVLSLDGSNLRQLTSFTRQKAPEPAKPGKIEQWYADQQKALFHELGGGRGGFGMFGGRRFGGGSASARKAFVLEDNQSLSSLDLSPDGQYVIFRVGTENPVKGAVVPAYATRSGYTETIPSHPKAAEVSWSTKAGIMSTATGEVKWIDYGQGQRPISPDAITFSPDGKTCLISADSDDRKDAWLLGLDLKTGATKAVEHVHDDAWIGELDLIGPYWHPSSARIFYISEKDGFSHIYSCAPDGRDKVQLTKGRFEVRDMDLSNDGRRVYFHSSEAHPGELHYYVMSSQGGPRTRLTAGEGQDEAVLSPDERYLAVLTSTSNTPPELTLQAAKPGAAARRITLSTTELFRSYDWMAPEVLSFKARDGVDVYARLFKPKAWQAKHPAVIFIHGAGYLQNAHKGWSEYFREYMFHNFLAANGYLVFDIDYRGSSGYGRDFRTGIYRHMGGKDLDDIVDGARFLVSTYGAGAADIGVYGGSYGGFLTLMAMFKEGDVIRAGAALRPVTDWAHYHAFYTQDILNLPQDDPEAYKQSSPIYFAEGLKGALLICHGMVDTNVHFQDTVRLVQRLIELGKEGWQVAFYPVEDHSFRNASSWTDEYRRIFNLFESNLK